MVDWRISILSFLTSTVLLLVACAGQAPQGERPQTRPSNRRRCWAK